MTFNHDKNFSKPIGKYNKIINVFGLRGRPYIDSIVSSSSSSFSTTFSAGDFSNTIHCISKNILGIKHLYINFI